MYVATPTTGTRPFHFHMPSLPAGAIGSASAIPSARMATSPAFEGVRMLDDPRLSWWPKWLSGKQYKEVDVPLEGGTSWDKPVWVPHVRQGSLGDCWLMGTLAAMALAKDPKYQPGIRRLDADHVAVRFGDREMGVRDTLPVKKGDKLYLARPNRPHFDAAWPAYYEKAAAALRGGYGALDGGWPAEAFELILGSRPARYRAPEDMLGAMRAALDAGLPVAVTTRSQQSKAMTERKLYANHTYAVRKFVEVARNGGPAPVAVKLWNPWGREHPVALTEAELDALCDSVTTPSDEYRWAGR